MSRSAVTELKNTFATGRTRSFAWRTAQLAAIQDMLLDNEERWSAALEQDLGKSQFESWTTEISQVTTEIAHLRKNLSKWMREKCARTPMALAPASSHIRRDPLGVVVVIAPWNYPLQLMLSPLAGAVAGGNCVVIKPSEISTAIESLTAELIPQYMDPQAIRVETGGPEASNSLIDQKPDHVFFTGSTPVGGIIAERCGKQLIPYTLELGGKSPVYVHPDTNLRTATRRLVWAKFTNAGQTCVAPDHVYVHEDVADKFARMLSKEIRRQFGPRPEKSADYGRIITTRHAQRLVDMLETSPVYSGGDANVAERYIQPTVVYPADELDATMDEEIFGPILPVLPVAGPEDAVKRIHTRDKPLAFYVFAKDKSVRRYLLDNVASGGVAINAALIHLSTPLMPFGGVGGSGQGNYHGEWSFKTFTHERSVMSKPLFPDTLSMVTAPVAKSTKWLMRNLLMRPTKSPASDVKLARRLNGGKK